MDSHAVRTEVGQKLKNDGDLIISIGKSRNDTNWKNKIVRWSALVAKLSESKETSETHAEFMDMKKDEQDRIKDIGGFVGGHLKDGRRTRQNVKARQIVTLDADTPEGDFWGRVQDMAIDWPEFAALMYSTHKHTPDSPRLRLVIPLAREVSPDEYGAIARKIADAIGMDTFDDTTYETNRLMYWPSHSADVEPAFEIQDAPFLDPDEVLSRYKDWTDVAEWPTSSRENNERRKKAEKAEDPLTKTGTIGAFCRTYTITEAIRKFLPDVYAPTAKEDRWTYTAGTTSGGMVIYDDDRMAYSHHSTDPISGLDVNAFDLVRIHKFGELDEDDDHKRVQDKPSYKRMMEFAAADHETQVTLAMEKHKDAADDFTEPADDDERTRTEWLLQFHKVSQKTGIPLDIIDVAIADYIKSSQEIILLAGVPYIYQDGVYVLDESGAQIKTLIRGCIFRDLISIARIERVYKLLIAGADLRHDIDDINRHPKSWINCRNGMLDLKTLELHPHSPKYYSLSQLPFAWDPDYQAPDGSIMEEYLQAAIPKDDDRRMFLEYAGYCLSTYTGFQKYLILTGDGGIGKSVLLGLIEGIVGTRNTSAISLQSLSGRFYSRFLYGKILNACGDLSSEAMTDTSTLKLVTGEDSVQAEVKGGEVFQFKPYVKLLFSANRIPATRDEQSNAFYRRLLILPLQRAEKFFPDLKERLQDDLETFFHLAVEAGSEAFNRGSLTESESSRLEVQDLHDRTDTVSAFLRTCTKKEARARCKTTDAYAAYEGYCLENDRGALSRTGFRANMKEKGFGIVTIRGVEHFLMLQLDMVDKVEDF